MPTMRREPNQAWRGLDNEGLEPAATQTTEMERIIAHHKPQSGTMKANAQLSLAINERGKPPCAGDDQKFWLGTHYSQISKARQEKVKAKLEATCGRCPVRVECKGYADASQKYDGKNYRAKGYFAGWSYSRDGEPINVLGE